MRKFFFISALFICSLYVVNAQNSNSDNINKINITSPPNNGEHYTENEIDILRSEYRSSYLNDALWISKNSGFAVPRAMFDNKDELLVYLFFSSSMEKKEREDCFFLYQFYTKEQKYKMYDILNTRKS